MHLALMLVKAMLAEVPVHSLPWYFGAAAFGVWAAAATGFILIVRRRIRARAERRLDLARSRPRPRSSPTGPIRDERSLGTGTDVEPLR